MRRRVNFLDCIVLLVLGMAGCRLEGGAVQQASLLADRGHYSEAISLLERETNHPLVPLASLRQLMRLYAFVGNWGKVTYIFERLGARLPANSPEPWLELGHAYELTHDYSEALAAYDRATEVAPKDSRGPAVAGQRAARWGQWDLAERRLRVALSRSPGDSKLFHTLGFVLFSAGRNEEAKAAYRQGLEQSPIAQGNRLGLATLALSEQEPSQALVQYEALIEAQPNFAAAYLGRSWSLLLLGRYSLVEAALRDAELRGADAQVVRRQRKHLQMALKGPTSRGNGELAL